MFSNRGIQQSQAVRRRTSVSLPYVNVEPASTLTASRSSRYKLSMDECTEEPTLKTIVSDLWWVISAKFRRAARCFRKNGPFYARILLWLFLLLGIAFAILASTLAFLFIQNELKPICKVPPGMDWKSQNQPPLVEYYVHGRGNGHYARSIAVVNDLVENGIDVRMYIGRATMYKAVNQIQHTQPVSSNLKEEDGRNGSMDTTRRGEITAISVPSLIPGLGLLDAISMTAQRLLTDCSISMSTGRYPTLVISDGDMPGMLRAKIGSIPSVSLAHGQLFVVSHKPDWVSDDPVLSHAWDLEVKKNRFASWFSDVIIGTNFVDMDTSKLNNYGLIARSPIRREIIQVGKERQMRKKLLGHTMSSDGDVLRGGNIISRGTLDSHLSPWHVNKINELLLGTNVARALDRVHKAIHANEMNKLYDPTFNLRRRKIILAYFRDKNGEKIIDFLLKSGFDVLLFERVDSKNFESYDVKASSNGSKRQTNNAPEDMQNLSLQEYWRNIANKYDLRLLDDDNYLMDLKSDSDPLANPSESEEITNEEESIKDEMPLDTATDTLNRLLKSDKFQKPRIIHVPDMSLFVPFLTIADGVVSSAGSQLMSESIFCHISILALHLEDDAEQRLNIQMSKHRFNKLSRKGYISYSPGRLVSDNMEYFAEENVVHGMSIENFLTVSQKVAVSFSNDDQYVLSDAMTDVIFGNNLVEKSIFMDLKNYIESVQKSSISFSYYNELFGGIVNVDTASPEKSVSLDAKRDSDNIIDPFQGMPTASAVIIKILEDIATK